MKLAAVSIAPLAARLEEPVANSRAQWSRREGALVQLLSDDGAMGQGEASPLRKTGPARKMAVAPATRSRLSISSGEVWR